MITNKSQKNRRHFMKIKVSGDNTRKYYVETDNNGYIMRGGQYATHEQMIVMLKRS